MSESLRVLVVDDEKLSRHTSRRQLLDAGFHAEAVENGYRALEEIDANPWDVVLCDLRMPGMNGIAVLETVRREHPDVDVILMTAYATVQTAVTAMQAGAADYLTKPFHFEELAHRLRTLAKLRSYRHELRSLRELLDDGSDWCGIVGVSESMRGVIQQARVFADQSAPVLISGETGTGKELFARAIHQRGPRAPFPFVAVACGAIPGQLADSELFGHEKGAFTGATAQRAGAFERANRGILLLDDVDDLPPTIQAKLLRTLQEGTVMRVGGGRELEVDVRVVTTTKVDLGDAVEDNRFRKDLYYRLRGLEIQLQPLRTRGDDVLLLTQHFLRLFAHRSGGEELSLSPQAAEILFRYPWPGNVRELRHTIEALAVVCTTSPIEVNQLPEYVRKPADLESQYFSLHLEGRDRVPLAQILSDVEREIVGWALRKAGGQQSRAAQLVDLPRTTFQSKLRARSDS